MRLLIVSSLCAALVAGPALAQGTSFDGTYRGEPTSGSGCTVLHPVLRVQGGTATFRFNSTTEFEGAVGSDGSLFLTNGKRQLGGKFAGGKFEGQVGGNSCNYPLSLSK